MIIVVATAVGVLSALWSVDRVRRLGEARLVGLWLVWAAMAIQLVLFEVLGRVLPLGWSNAIHLSTYALTVWFIFRNRHLPGALLIGSGASCNLAAIAANGGTMPANMTAWAKAGLRPIPPDVFENSAALADPRLAVLGDIFYVPASWPLSNVFSIGDVLLVVGGTWFAHRWCATVPTERLELSLTAT